MKRRNFIRGSLVVIGATTLGGCSSSYEALRPSFPTYDIPAYSAWPPAEPRTSDFVLFTHSNIQLLHDTQNGTPTPTPDDGNDRNILFGLPAYGFTVTNSTFSNMQNYPWSDTLGQAEEPSGMATDALTRTEGTFIFHGDYDVEVFVYEYADGFDKSDGPGEFIVFEGQTGGDTEGLAYAVSTNTVVAVLDPDATSYGFYGLAPDPHENVHRLYDGLDNWDDKVERVVDDDDGQWLFETTGPADIVTGIWRVNGLDDLDHLPDENPVFDNVDSLISMLALPSDEGGVGGDNGALRFAALYPEGEVPSADELRDVFLTDDSDRELDITSTNDRVHLAARTSEEDIEELTS